MTIPTSPRSRSSLAERFWSKVSIVKDRTSCWVWTAGFFRSRSGKSYGCFSVGSRTDGTRRMAFCHHVSWELTNGSIPKGTKVLHRCDNQACVRPDHLFLGTQKDNVRDMTAKGRKRPAAGERHGSARLIAKQVSEIRKRYRPGRAETRRHWGLSMALRLALLQTSLRGLGATLHSHNRDGALR